MDHQATAQAPGVWSNAMTGADLTATRCICTHAHSAHETRVWNREGNRYEVLGVSGCTMAPCACERFEPTAEPLTAAEVRTLKIVAAVADALSAAGIALRAGVPSFIAKAKKEKNPW